MHSRDVRALSRQQLTDLAEGSAILASGGGGPVSMIAPLVDAILAAGTPLLADISAVGDDDRVTCSFGAGSPAAVSASPTESAQKLTAACLAAFDSFARAVGHPIDYTVAIETGVINTLLPFYVAAKRGIPVIDGAGGRRSVPTITLTSFALADTPFAPMLFSNGTEPSIRVDAATAAQGEAPMMGIVSTDAFSSSAGLCAWQIPGRQAASHIEVGTVTYAMNLGATLRAAREGEADPVASVTEYLEGTVLLKGTLGHNTTTTSSSWDFQQILFKGNEKELRLYAQNETLIAWSSHQGQPLAMGPDLICYLTADGQVFSNADLDSIEGQQVAIIGAPSTPLFQEQAVVDEFLALLAGLGYGGSYVPLRSDTAGHAPSRDRRQRQAALRALRRHGRF